METPDKSTATENKKSNLRYPGWLIAGTWVLAVLMVGLMGFSLYRYFTGQPLFSFLGNSGQDVEIAQASSLPEFEPTQSFAAVERNANPDTVLPAGFRQDVVEYTITLGDSLFGIAERYEVEPETIMYANYDTLKDNPHTISVGVNLKIPPVDGVYYQWKAGDTLEKIAGEYHATVDDILFYTGNDLDITNPVIEPGTFIMIPNGWRLLNPFVVAVSAGEDAGVTAKINGPGSCSPSGTFYGSFPYVWPAGYPGQVSGNDYWSGHQAIDAQCFEGDAIYASGAGVVIYAGWIEGGYGYMVAIDHQVSGYLTLYAHLSSINVSCGQTVGDGQVIASCGSTGNSTGAHLHFEVRQNGGFVNPWHVLQ